MAVVQLADWYFKGNRALKDKTRNPTIVNLYSQHTIHNGFWGDWTDWEYCTAISSIDQGGSLRAGKISGFRLRTEGKQGGGDDTALNGIEVYCETTRTQKTITSGFWGGWQNWGWCPSGYYAFGAQMRVEGTQGGGDDTAGNSVNIMCNNGQAIGSHGGFWGG
ncbi:hypothetical protein GPECTOR_12g377 [Gonium pectorale]|uniref:Uncharacterized protein n=1 Tax=Gonium pectorale TaxID=33097 RepID=A0A150GNR0_GONPE|nr:hypothetical protein GPECTOR_12g377 [Gonium pectorale]|eukprot:KXZ51415.1 hypothetical protein GPECTOR_12g377 [Gonium pectorale]